MTEKIYKIMRKLAKSDKWQTIYNLSKDSNIQMFNNIKDLSNLQISFVGLLGFYSNLNLDIVMDDVDKKILDNDIYTDSWVIYNKEKKKKQQNQNQQTSSTKKVVNKESMIFTTGKQR